MFGVGTPLQNRAFMCTMHAQARNCFAGRYLFSVSFCDGREGCIESINYMNRIFIMLQLNFVRRVPRASSRIRTNPGYTYNSRGQHITPDNFHCVSALTL